MAQKKYKAGETHGFIGDSRSKSKPKPFTESNIVTDYMAKRNEFDWTPEPPSYTGPIVTIEDLRSLSSEKVTEQQKIEFGLIGAKSASTAKVITEAEEKEKKQSSEFALQTKICGWLNDTWPGLIFYSDFAAGLFLPPHIASSRKAQACIDKYPDLSILSPRGNYHALIIELKTLDGTPFLKDGKTLKSSEHIKAQNHTLTKLKGLGYCACFGVGEVQIKRIIMKYMGFELTKRV